MSLLLQVRKGFGGSGTLSASSNLSCPREPFGVTLIRVLMVLLVFSCALTAKAQKEIVTITNWRAHAGDNPAWAMPGFDDSQWKEIPYVKMGELGHVAKWNYWEGTSWYRATFPVPADFKGQELAIGVGPIQEVYDVYVDGVLVGRLGSWKPTPRGPFPRHLAFPIPAGLLKGAVGHVAIRRWKGGSVLKLVTFGASGYFDVPHPPEIGAKSAIEARERLHPSEGAIRELPWTLSYVLFLFAASISFVLFSVQRRRAEYLYLGLYCVLLGAPPLIAIPIVTSSSVMAQSWAPILLFFLNMLASVFSLLFLATLCPRFRYILWIGAAFSGIVALAAGYALGAQSYAATEFWTFGFTYGVAAFDLVAFWGLLLDRRKGSLAIAFCLLLSAADWGPLWAFASAIHLGGPSFEAGPFRVDLRAVPGVLFVFVTLLVLYQRYRDEQSRQATIDQDLAAARRMQEELLAESAKNPPGFMVDAVYRPARDVGGDFYRTEPLQDGSLLVIVGDVSGKGLDAAMLVAVVLGSLANETHRSPGSLLAYLNRAVMGRTGGGFITACCARFHPSGRAVMANAGHIAPYLDGCEMVVENGLPLGISADAAYAETDVTSNGKVMFVSDGVVEARDSKGELLGFERLAALTIKPAAEVAKAAQQWGQEDDITVLTVACNRVLASASA